MSKNLPDNPQNEEVDLGQLFKLIGNAFEKLFAFIGLLLNKLFLAFVWGVFFIKKYFIILVIATTIGFLYGLYKLKYSKPVYSTNAVIKQNYSTGESLYNLLNYYNDLILDKDTISLASSLNLEPNEASNLISFNLESVLNENSKLKVFNKFKKEVDSTIASEVDFETFLENSSDYDYEHQRLTVRSTSKSLPRKILPKVIENIESIEFFKSEQEKDLAELTLREQMILESLKESDSLQKVYEAVLQKDDVDPSAQTSVLINNAEEQNSTREFELFKNDIELRRELVAINRAREDKKKIVEVISSQQDEGIVDSTVEVLEYKLNYKYYYALIAFVITFLTLSLISFLKFLDKYKERV